MTRVYMCDECGSLHKTAAAAEVCELSHITDNRKRQIKILQMNNLDPCYHCERAYFVYGCEWACQCEAKCKDYSLFILKKD